MNETRKAAFNYASQDPQAAAKLTQALRSAGIEVWLDDPHDTALLRNMKRAPNKRRERSA